MNESFELELEMWHFESKKYLLKIPLGIFRSSPARNDVTRGFYRLFSGK